MKLGLTDDEVKNSIKEYGLNEIKNPKPRTLFNVIIESFSDPIIKILLVALAIKIVFLFRDFNWYETLGILIAIFLATFISSISEYGSEAAFKKLQEENKDILVKVYRNNKLTNINMSSVVVKDLVFLEQGDLIPADGHIVKGSVQVDESILTGESKLIKKECNGKLYKGTVIYEGTCNMIVDGIGSKTMFGSIAEEIIDTKKVSPLKKRLVSLARVINKVGYVGAFLVSFSYLFSSIIINNNFDINIIKNYIANKGLINDLIYALTLCVTTIVVAVPEGLPMMITLVLSSNMKKLIKNNVLVRKMVGIETAGNINFLLTDKTGTITVGELQMISYISLDFHEYKSVHDIKGKYQSIVLESLIYNNASSYINGEIIGGNKTDMCIMDFIKDKYQNKILANDFTPFNSEKKYSKVKIKDYYYVKGAYDIIINQAEYVMLPNTLITKIDKNSVNKHINLLTKKGYRVIANMLEKDGKKILIGIICIKDVIRKESYQGIKNIKRAGINVIMVTGDHKDTANVIAKEVGIIDSHKNISYTSRELSMLSDEEIIKNIDNIKVISRALPSDKSRLVSILQKNGYVVGMTGDGVNDAPALKKSDVGFAMGTGTSIAKEASDIIILDNNLLSISKAILFGRTIFKSIRKFIKYQLSVNCCALTLSIIGPFIGINTPITIIQMLWLNMIMDTLAGLAFSFEPSLDEYLDEKPKRMDEHVISKKMYIDIIINGVFSALICLIFLKLPIIKEIYNYDHRALMTAYFALFIFIGINIALLTRTNRVNYLRGLKGNPLFIIIFVVITIIQIFIIYFGGSIFSTYGLSFKGLLFVICLSCIIIIPSSIRKLIIKEKDE